MIDKLKKIAELAPELLGGLNVQLFNHDSIQGSQDRQWILIGRLIGSLKTHKVPQYVRLDMAQTFNPSCSCNGIEYQAPTLLEAVCDAWLALKGGE